MRLIIKRISENIENDAFDKLTMPVTNASATVYTKEIEITIYQSERSTIHVRCLYPITTEGVPVQNL